MFIKIQNARNKPDIRHQKIKSRHRRSRSQGSWLFCSIARLQSWLDPLSKCFMHFRTCSILMAGRFSQHDKRCGRWLKGEGLWLKRTYSPLQLETRTGERVCELDVIFKGRQWGLDRVFKYEEFVLVRGLERIPRIWKPGLVQIEGLWMTS